jgi:hypothetical protein
VDERLSESFAELTLTGEAIAGLEPALKDLLLDQSDYLLMGSDSADGTKSESWLRRHGAPVRAFDMEP